MAGEWKCYPMGDIATFAYGKMPKSNVLTEGLYPTFSGYKYQYRYPEYNCEKGDVIVVARGVGGTGDVKIVKERCYLTNLSIKITLDPSVVDNRYFYYNYLNSNLRHLDSGSAQSQITINDLSRVMLILPALPEQKAIAHILGSLDDKIELNRKMNATLEQMAQVLFKSWFIDFDPVIDNILAKNMAKYSDQNQPSPNLSQRERDNIFDGIPDEFADRAEIRRQALAEGTANRSAAKSFPSAFQFTKEMGWIPEGWEGAKLSDLLDVKYGKDHKRLAEGSIPVYGSGGLMRYADKALYSGESVLIPRKGTLSNILYLNEKFWTVDTMFYTTPKSKYVLKYAFYHLKSLDFASMNVGSAVPSMTTKVLNALPIVMPAESALHNFDSILTTYFNRIEANNTQSSILSKLRDFLLPKLISGEMRIKDAEQIVDEQLT